VVSLVNEEEKSSRQSDDERHRPPLFFPFQTRDKIPDMYHDLCFTHSLIPVPIDITQKIYPRNHRTVNDLCEWFGNLKAEGLNLSH
jgi:hypothetical protein